MRSEVFSAERTAQQPTSAGMTRQNPFCVRYAVDGTVLARQGTMVAYRGDLELRTKSQGAMKFLKRAVTGEGVPLMEVEGRGEIWLADLAKNVFVVSLEQGDALSVNGKSVLCFDPSLEYEIRRVEGAGMFGGGLFNCEFEGAGSVAVTADGEPMVIPVTPDAPVRVDTDAAIGWSSSLTTSIHRSEGVKSFLKGGSGEMFQLVLEGDGFVVVQPSEGPVLPQPGQGDGEDDEGGGGLSGLFGS